MTTLDPWSEFEELRQGIRLNTVDRLKHILGGLNDECHAILFKTGKKQDLIQRIVNQLDDWRKTNNVDKWIRAKAVLHMVRNSGIYSPNKMPSPLTLSVAAAPHHPYAADGAHQVPKYLTPQGSSNLPRYDPYAPPRRPNVPPMTSMPVVPKMNLLPGIRFKPSPFLRVDQVVSHVVECPESASSNDRRQQHVSFLLNNDQIAKLRSVSPKYQLRLYCTSSSFYSSGPNAFRTNLGPCPIEFPPTCEVRVNNVQLAANLKGLKKKPGTAPPPDLGRNVRLTTSSNNRVEMLYVNSQQPSQPKKYHLVVMLVEVTTVGQLVERLRKGKYRSSQDILLRMGKSPNYDEDIIAGPQKMSLKCPLSFIRIETPCRSSHCVHPQCFDATSWFSVMEQTTTWLCPVCEKVLDPEDLIMDGYFDQILKETPEDVEDIMVEADGEWHTLDNRYASPLWKSLSGADEGSLPSESKPSSSRRSASPAKSENKAQVDDEIVILDSDDEDEGRVKRELSPSFGSGSAGNRSFSIIPPASSPRTGDVIDLTVDSEDDEPSARTVSPAPSSKIAGKRKATDPDSPSSTPKKTRADDNDNLMRAMAMRTLSMPLNANMPSSPGRGSRDSAAPYVTRSPPNTVPPPRFASATSPPRYQSRYDDYSPFYFPLPTFNTPSPSHRSGGRSEAAAPTLPYGASSPHWG